MQANLDVNIYIYLNDILRCSAGMTGGGGGKCDDGWEFHM